MSDPLEILGSLAEKALAKARGLGAGDAEFYGVWSRELMIKISGGHIERIKDKSIGKYSVRVAVGSKTGIYGSEELSEEAVEGIVEAALRIAKSSAENPGWKGFARGYGRASIEGVYDDRTASMEASELMEIVKKAMDAGVEAARKRGAKEATIPRGMIGARVDIYYIANMNGESIHGRATGAGAWIQVKARRKGEESSYSVFWTGRRMDEEEIYRQTAEAGELAVEFVKAKAMESGVYRIYLMPRVAAYFLSSALAPALSALNVQEKRSPLRDRVGEEVLSPSITILDDPHMPWAIGCREFDDEGIKTSRKPLFQKGVLAGYVYDYYTASREGRESTGNAIRRSITSPPTPSVLNMVVEGGDISDEDVARELREGIIVYDAIGYWMSNPVNGNIMATVSHGFYVKGGKIKHPIKGAVITGNIYRLLKEDLVGLGRKRLVLENVVTPGVMAERINVAGKK